jgi:PDZ domain-containing protein
VRRALIGVSLAVVVLALIVVPLPLVELRPGPALDVASQIDFQGTAHPVSGKLLLTTVTLSHPSAVGVLEDVLAHHDLLPESSVIPPGVDERQYLAAQKAIFDESLQVAAAVGLKAAGYPVSVSGGGVEVTAIIKGSPAVGKIDVGDVIQAVDGHPVQLASDVQASTESATAGQLVTLTILRGNQQLQIQVRLRQVSQIGRPGLGVVLRTLTPKVSLPFPITVRNQDIGGPSAGLMMALTVYQLASGTDLTRGRTVAGTGTIDITGSVGPVGGVAEKIRGAERAGATVFLVPRSEAAQARSAGTRLQVVPVTSFDEALRALRQ